MKKIVCFVCAFLLCLWVALPVGAIGTSQTYELVALGDSTLAFKALESPAFWEHPTLKAGEKVDHFGAFIIRNSTASTQKIGLRTVELPYENEEALRYLNHLNIIVKNGETVVYDGAYSCINDGAGIDLNTELAPNSTVAFSIQLRCDFEYAGSGLAEEDMINWLFYAVVTQDEEPVKERFSDSALYEVILACGAALIVLTGIVVYDRFWKQRHN